MRKIRGNPRLIAVAFIVLICPALLAQKSAPPKYNVEAESKAKGSIEEIKLPASNPKDSIHLLVKEGEEVLDVTLCPKSFLDDMGMSFAKGDVVALTISKIKQEGAPDVILARDVARGEDKLILRDDKGAPVWNWKR
jgi:hypothetical protein